MDGEGMGIFIFDDWLMLALETEPHQEGHRGDDEDKWELRGGR